jgi:hypothetical protein
VIAKSQTSPHLPVTVRIDPRGGTTNTTDWPTANGMSFAAPAVMAFAALLPWGERVG